MPVVELDTIKASDAFGPGSSPGGHTKNSPARRIGGGVFCYAEKGREAGGFGKSLDDFLLRSKAPGAEMPPQKLAGARCVCRKYFFVKGAAFG